LKQTLSTSQIKVDLAKIEHILRTFGPEGDFVVDMSEDIENSEDRLSYMVKMARILAQQIKMAEKYTENPVSIKTFVTSSEYMNQPDVLYPKVLEELTDLNSGKYVESVLTGGIGTGKTTVALYTTAYQLYLLSLLKSPHKEFEIAPSDEIVFVFQSITSTLAKSVDYSRFKAMIDQSPYFQMRFKYDKQIASELRFPNRIIVKAVSGADTAAIGQNVFGGVLDEVNFMAVTENSKNAKDGGTYDQAWENYRAIVRRRESRFMNKGQLPGMLCLVSSKQYPGEFTDIKIEEAKTNPKIFVYDKRVWEVKGDHFFSGEWFNVFCGDAFHKPRILDPDEKVKPSQETMILRVPEEYRNSFESDLLSAIRDIGGMSTLALHPFITDVEQISACFGKAPSILSRGDCDFVETQTMFYPSKFRNLNQPRFVHIDLGITGDSAGVACGYVDRFVEVKRGDSVKETLPHITFDFLLRVNPPKDGEILFHKIRTLLYKLMERNFPIKWATLDTFQSTDTIQLLAQRGIQTGAQSVDTNTVPFDITKSAFMDGRVALPEHEVAQLEVLKLERDPKTNKIDHPPKGSKDVADAIAGVVYGLTMRREVWLHHGIPIVSVPESIINANVVNKNSVDTRAGEVPLRR